MKICGKRSLDAEAEPEPKKELVAARVRGGQRLGPRACREPRSHHRSSDSAFQLYLQPSGVSLPQERKGQGPLLGFPLCTHMP